MPSLKYNTLAEVLSEINKTQSDFPLFVETGTHEGDTSLMASKKFDQVYTIEIFELLYLKAKQRFENLNIKVFCGDSIFVLPQILKDVTRNCIFWLDGHNSGPGTGVGKIDFPVIQECEIIDEKFKGPEALILIDDVRLFGKGHNAQIDESLMSINYEQILNCFKIKKIKKHLFFDSSLAKNDRLAIHIIQ